MAPFVASRNRMLVRSGEPGRSGDRILRFDGQVSR